MVVRIEYRGIPVRLEGEMVGGAFAATAVGVEAFPGPSPAGMKWGAKVNTANLLATHPTHTTTLLGDLEWEATQWYAKQPTLAWMGVNPPYLYYCTDCGVPEGTVEAERVIDAADLNDDGVPKVCPTCGEYVHRDERGKA